MLGRTPEISSLSADKRRVISDFEITEADGFGILLRRCITQGFCRRELLLPFLQGTEVEKRAVKRFRGGAGAREVFLYRRAIAAAIGVACLSGAGWQHDY